MGSDVTMTFSGKHLKALRTAAQFTQLELAKQLGISRETVVAIETENKGSFQNLSMANIKKWWEICESKASAPAKKEFKKAFFDLFGL